MNEKALLQQLTFKRYLAVYVKRSIAFSSVSSIKTLRQKGNLNL